MSTTHRRSALLLAAGQFTHGGGEHTDPDTLDAHLVDIADNAARALLAHRIRCTHPHTTHRELLSTVAALRAVLGLSPTPTADEVTTWQDRQHAVRARAAEGPTTSYPTVFTDGPYCGIVMELYGPTTAYPAADDPLGHLTDGWIAGPPSTTSLPITWGADSELPGYGTVRYKRGYAPAAEGLWPYRMRTGDPKPPAGARPDTSHPSGQF
ncbi:hypothetical protein [Streptomyces sp. NPDC047315]|uniref:hypothetical protein n=1 Tax=Streptomyces sp. NPDC047315 TaxID=3155142 RepID=UPI0033FACAF1